MTFLTSEDVAQMLRVSPKTVSRWCLEDATMPVTRIGRTVRFEAQALERWLRAHGRRKTGSGDVQVTAPTGEAL